MCIRDRKDATVGVSPSATFQALNEDYRPPESYQWNLTVSREIFRDTVLEASYIGNHGLHIWRRNVAYNDIPPGVPCKGGDAVGCDPALPNDARFQIASRVRQGLSTDDMVSANRRFPGLGPIDMVESSGNSSYHAMQLWLNRRFTKGLAFQAAYTWAHAISDVSLTPYTDSVSDPFNYKLDKGDADLDRRHSFIGNVVYVLPSFNRWGSMANTLLGEWQINSICLL